MFCLSKLFLLFSSSVQWRNCRRGFFYQRKDLMILLFYYYIDLGLSVCFSCFKGFLQTCFLHNSEVPTTYLMTFSLHQWYAVTDTFNCWSSFTINSHVISFIYFMLTYLLPILCFYISLLTLIYFIFHFIFLFLYFIFLYWFGVQQGQSYFMGRRCLFSLVWPNF